MSDDLGKIAYVRYFPHRTVSTIRQNIAVSLINVAFMVVAALLGNLGLVTGLLLNEASAVFVILNALRLLKWKSPADTGTPVVSEVNIPVPGTGTVLKKKRASVSPATGGSCCSCTETTLVVSKPIPETGSAAESCCSCTAPPAEIPAPVVEVATSSCCCSVRHNRPEHPLLLP